MRNKILVCLIVSFFIFMNCVNSSNNETIASSYLNGTWSTIPIEKLDVTNAYEEQFGWGIGKSVTNSTIYFDLIEKSMYVDPGLAWSPIIDVESLDHNRYKVTGAKYNAAGEEYKYFYIIQFLTKNKIIIQFKTDLKNVFGDSLQQMSEIYYRISGPGTAVQDN